MATPERLASFLAAGFPAPAMPVHLYRAQSLGKFHTTTMCSRSRANMVNHEIVFTDGMWDRRGPYHRDRWCSSCRDKTSGSLRSWLDGATAIAEAINFLASVTSAPQDIVGAAQMDALARKMLNIATAADGDPDLALFAREKLDAIERLRSSADDSVVRGAVVAASGIWKMLEGRSYNWRIPLDPHRELLIPKGRNHTGSSVPPVPYVRAWDAFVASSAAGATAARDAALAAAMAAIEATGTAHWTRVPDAAVLDPSVFSHPKEWAATEWRLAAFSEAERVIESWAAAYAGLLTDVEPHVVLIYGWSPDAEKALTRSVVELLGPYSPVGSPSTCGWTLLPAIVAEHVTAVTPRLKPAVPRVFDLGVRDISRRVLETAAALHEIADGTLVDAALTALETAELLEK